MARWRFLTDCVVHNRKRDLSKVPRELRAWIRRAAHRPAAIHPRPPTCRYVVFCRITLVMIGGLPSAGVNQRRRSVRLPCRLRIGESSVPEVHVVSKQTV